MEEQKGKLETQTAMLSKQYELSDLNSKQVQESNKTLAGEKAALFEIKNNLIHENTRLSKLKQNLQTELEKEQSQLDHMQTLYDDSQRQ